MINFRFFPSVFSFLHCLSFLIPPFVDNSSLFSSQLPSLTSDPEKCEGEPTFIFDSEHFDVLSVEIG